MRRNITPVSMALPVGLSRNKYTSQRPARKYSATMGMQISQTSLSPALKP